MQDCSGTARWYRLQCHSLAMKEGRSSGRGMDSAAGRNGAPALSWCTDQSGLIANGTAPRFSLCSDGMNWFQSAGKWQGNSYQPSAGTIIFFDWNGDGNPDHVGIIEINGEWKGVYGGGKFGECCEAEELCGRWKSNYGIWSCVMKNNYVLWTKIIT